MILEVGKKYVLSDGRVARCICNDRQRIPASSVKSALLLWQKGDAEFILHTAADGGPLRYGFTCVVKEYIPPVKVRVFLYSYEHGPVQALAFMEGESGYERPAAASFSGPRYHVFSDTIVEVEMTK